MGVPLQPNGDVSVRVSAAMMSLVCISLVARVWSRFKTPKGFTSPDDALIALATAVFYAEQILFLYSMAGDGASGGSNVTLMTLPQLNRFSKYLYAQEILFVLCITLVKLSILTFYRRIFSVRSFVRLTWVVFTMCVIWAIICIFVIVFQCRPVHAMWDIAMQLAQTATCIKSEKLIFGFEVSNVAIDLLILALPVYRVQRLQLPTAKKISVSCIFLLGLFVCGACAVRSYYVWDPATDATRSSSTSMDWTTIELATALVCANLPTYGPILFKGGLATKISEMYKSLRGSIQSRRSQSIPTTAESTKQTVKGDYSEYDQLVDGPEGRFHHAAASAADGSEHKSGAYAMNRIRVQRSVEVV